LLLTRTKNKGSSLKEGDLLLIGIPSSRYSEVVWSIPFRDICRYIFPTELKQTYSVIQKPVKWLVKCTKHTLEMYLLLTEFTKIVQIENLHVQCTTRNAVIPFYKLTGKFKSEHSREYERISQIN
jgi:hypothetical protein